MLLELDDEIRVLAQLFEIRILNLHGREGGELWRGHAVHIA